jgi:hypothetical protein
MRKELGITKKLIVTNQLNPYRFHRQRKRTIIVVVKGDLNFLKYDLIF